MAFTFGATANPTTNIFGATTANPTTTAAAPTTGFTFGGGATATSAAPTATTGSFGFGTPAAAAPATTTPAPFAFGAPAAAATTTAPFGFGATANPTTTATSIFGTPATTTTAAAPFGFGATANPTTTATSIFGAPATTTTAAAPFGFGAATNPATTTASIFGAPATTTTFGFQTFGGANPTTATAATNVPGFNLGTAQNTMQTFGATNTLGAAPGNQAVRPDDILITSLTSPRLFNDEREELMLKWNILQVFYGTGKIFCHQGGLDVDPNLAYHVFKTYSYSVRPRSRDEDGLVTLVFNRKVADVVRDKDKTLETLHRNCFSNNPNCIIDLEGISPLADDRTQMLIVVSMKDSQSLTVKKIKSSDVVNHLQPTPPQPTTTTTFIAQPVNPNKVHLDALGIVQIFARIDLSEQEYKQYLDSIPPGLTAFVWEQAKKENPKPHLLLPVPLIGVKALRERMKAQFIEHEDQKQQLELIRQQLHSVKDQCDSFRLTMKRFQTTLLEYSHRILKATIQFELRRRQHDPKLSMNEIQISTSLQTLQQGIQPPLDSRVKDLIMKIRMNPSLLAPIQWSKILHSNDSLRFDKDKIEQIKDILQEIHRGVKSVVELTQNDRTTLAKIEDRINHRK